MLTPVHLYLPNQSKLIGGSNGNSPSRQINLLYCAKTCVVSLFLIVALASQAYLFLFHFYISLDIMHSHGFHIFCSSLDIHASVVMFMIRLLYYVIRFLSYCVYSIMAASRPWYISTAIDTRKVLTKPLRNMLTFLNFISACKGGVDEFLALWTVCRIYQSALIIQIREHIQSP